MVYSCLNDFFSSTFILFQLWKGLFGKQLLHCGLVVRQQHRHWVHVVGSDYDLIEWDAPDVVKMGVKMLFL
jgi:hypothetical protein